MKLFCGFQVTESDVISIKLKKGKSADYIKQICCVLNNFKILMFIAHVSVCHTEIQINLEQQLNSFQVVTAKKNHLIFTNISLK